MERVETILSMKRYKFAIYTETGWTFKAGETLPASVAYWERVLKAPEDWLEVVRHGWKGSAYADVEPVYFKNYKLTPEDHVFVDTEILALRRCGAIAQVTDDVIKRWGEPPRVLAPLFVACQVKPRLIIDLRYLNLAECPPYFYLPGFAHMRGVVPPGSPCWMSKTDMKAGWHHVRIHESLEKYCCIEWQGIIYYYRVLPFGLSSAPYCFNQLGCIGVALPSAIRHPQHPGLQTGNVVAHPGLIRHPPSGDPGDGRASPLCRSTGRNGSWPQ